MGSGNGEDKVLLSVSLHCDPTASHYLKLLMDAVFGPGRFRSESIWKRSRAHSDTKQGVITLLISLESLAAT